MCDKDFMLLQSHLTPHPCGATPYKYQTDAALRVHLKHLYSLLLSFYIEQLCYSVRVAIKDALN